MLYNHQEKHDKNITCDIISAYVSTTESTFNNSEDLLIFFFKNQGVFAGDLDLKIELSKPKISNQKLRGNHTIKGTLNKNENLLIEFCKVHNISIINSFVIHKPS